MNGRYFDGGGCRKKKWSVKGAREKLDGEQRARGVHESRKG